MNAGSFLAQRIWIVTEFYYPDQNATGYLMTSLARGLGKKHRVHVACGRPAVPDFATSRFQEGTKEPEVHRIPSTHFNKDNLLLRLLNVVSFSISIFVALLFRLRKKDIVIVVTNPPTLPYLAKIAASIRNAVCIVLVYDVYPEVLVATGLLGLSNPLLRSLHAMTSRLLRSAEAVIVLGRDMKSLVTERYPVSIKHLKIIPNWVDSGDIQPMPKAGLSLLSKLNLENKFVVGYVGNMGRTHDIETLARVALMLQDETSVHFLFVGDGAKKQWLERFVVEHKLSNVTIIPFVDRTRQSEVHNACDIGVIAFLPGMAGLSVPSRLYNMMAAGKPVLAITDPTSELALVIHEEQIGWVVEAFNAENVARNIMDAKANPTALRDMGKRARAAAENKYSFDAALQSYEELISRCDTIDNAESTSHRGHTA